MKRSDEPIIIKETYHTDTKTVWDAITKPEQMRKWFFDNIPDFKPEVGFEVEFTVKSEDRVFPHHWRVTKVEPGKYIEYNWNYRNYQGDGYVCWLLEPVDGSTQLTLTNIITEDYPEDIPEFQRESCIGGWTFFINGRLKEYLAGKKQPQ